MKKILAKEKVYTLKGRINEIPFSKKTNDVRKTIESLKPQFVFCDTYLTLSKGAGKNKIVAERKLSLIQGKKIFNDDDFLDIFVNNLMVEFI